jgi:apolipoprotein D and lipocalin family protein
MLPRKPVLLNTLILSLLLCCAGCTSVPSGLQPVDGFAADRYLGRWYEIARLDHSFERGLTHVTADYSQQPDGSIAVVNRGYDPAKQEWRQVRGVARFRGDPAVGSLRVSFFGPFYGGYHILALDHQQYGYATVAGPSRGFLWILSRQPTLAQDVYDRLVAQAREWGFRTEGLIRVVHTPSPAVTPP